LLVAGLVCWFGACGEEDVTAPESDLSFDQLAVGPEHLCGIEGDRSYCWGTGSSGQLGTGELRDEREPRSVSTGAVFTSLSASGTFTCALTAQGQTYCWGASPRGQAGVEPDRSPLTAPLPVEGAPPFSMVTAGTSHACGVALDGVAYCWGENANGELGDGTRTQRHRPQPVAGAVVFASLSAGGSHTCGIASDGRAWCWGAHERGQLGVDSAGFRSTVPIPVDQDRTYASITAGSEHTCAVAADGSAYCWGSNDQGQLGFAGTPLRRSPTVTGGGRRYSLLAAAVTHTCGLVAGQAFCWGASFVPPTPLPTGLQWRWIDAAGARTCGLTTGEGRAACWDGVPLP
jgi:hypothetical protein